MAVLSLADLWFGNDGGMLHAAVALGPATVGIFGPTKAGRWGYNEPRHMTVSYLPDYQVKSDAQIRECLDTITVEKVVTAARKALQGVGD